MTLSLNPMVSTTSVSPFFIMAHGFSVPGWFGVLRMGYIQVDVTDLRPVVHYEDDLFRCLVEEDRCGEGVHVDTRHRGGPAAFMGTVGGLPRKHLVVGLFHRRLHPFLQDRIGELGDTIGWLRAATIGHVGVRFVVGNGPWSAARRRKQIVHANRAANPPAGAAICREIGNGSFATCVGCQGGACSRYNGHETNQTMFAHVPPLAANWLRCPSPLARFTYFAAGGTEPSR